MLYKLVETANAAYEDRQYSAATRSYELIGKHLGMFKDQEADDTARDTLEALKALAMRKYEKQPEIIDVPIGEQRLGTVRAMVKHVR